MQNSKNFIKKALFMSIGTAILCFTFWAIGELFLFLTVVPEAWQSTEIVMDVSGSMLGTKIEEVKVAASRFIDSQNLSPNNQVGIVTFGTTAKIESEPTFDKEKLKEKISAISAGGSTNLEDGLVLAGQQLKDREGKKNLIVFTDGVPNSKIISKKNADYYIKEGINVIAIATGDADISFLQEMTQNPALVFPVKEGYYLEAFKQAADALQLVETKKTDSSFMFELFRTAFWTGLIAIGMTLGLTFSHNRYMKNNIKFKEVGDCLMLAPFIGILSGATGQLLFSVAGQLSFISFLVRVISWGLLGMLVARGAALFVVPNMNVKKAQLGGAIGGALGGIAFLLAGSLFADALGRLIAVLILAVAIAVLTTVVEIFFCQAWLEIVSGNNKKTFVALGAKSVKIGNDNQVCNVYIPDTNLPVALEYRMEDNRIICKDCNSGGTYTMGHGDRMQAGGTKVYSFGN